MLLSTGIREMFIEKPDLPRTFDVLEHLISRDIPKFHIFNYEVYLTFENLERISEIVNYSRINSRTIRGFFGKKSIKREYSKKNYPRRARFNYR